MKAKILIVGGGVMGTAIAMRAARTTDPLAEPVVLLERRELGAGSSGRSGAILRQHYADRELAAMARDSLREYATFQTRTGRRIGFQRTGVLTLAGADSVLPPERLVANVEMQQSIGIHTRVVEAEEIRELVPGIEVADGAIGAWEPEAGFVDPQRTVQHFAALARTYGAVTRLGIEVTDIEVSEGRVRSVSTTEGRYETDQVVLVAGPWSAGLLAGMGVELPLRTVRPEQHFVALPTPEGADDLEDLAQTRIRGADLTDPLERISEEMAREQAAADRTYPPVVIDLDYGFYTRCEPETRRSRIGRTEYVNDTVLPDPDDIDEGVSPEMVTWAREVIARRLPAYENVPDMGSEAAWYTLTPDAQAVIGPVEGIEGLLVVTGFSGHGFKLAPSVSEGVVQMLAGEPVSAFDVEFFDPGRFGESPGWTGAFGL